ncbi:hypothetical protein DTO166G4_7745 [Paecilomyces variotii]|nr:hypothetical protein DTO166G4_7745 [Paecilomyces variotii]KAJ9239041.1 hypothetical protein DTO166G5_2571 [Paecilomyces variotii]KAJ9354063.1 hypothetical protein DTO027B9_4984 [Paecilomyces variotii]KAJ9371356.1 hypothetical protein DTO282E5_3963 [Paecilomyces variotii]
MPPSAPTSTPSRRGPPPGSSPQAPIIVPSEVSSVPDDVDELLRRLRGLLNEFRLLIVSLEAAEERHPYRGATVAGREGLYNNGRPAWRGPGGGRRGREGGE